MRVAPFAAGLILSVFVLPGAAENAPPSSPFINQVKSHFPAWDANKDGVLSREEIDALVSNPKVTGAEAAAVAALKRTVRNRKYKLSPLTAASLAALAAEKRPAGDKPDLNAMYASALARINKAGRELFPTGKPDLAGVSQGKLGDCFCLAPLGAMVCRNPLDVVKMIAREKDGTYSVRLGRQTVSVPALTDAELALTAATGGAGMWVNVYEKAVGLHRQQERKAASGSFIDLLGKGGSAGTMVRVVTGNEIVRFSCKLVRDAKTPAERQAQLARSRELLTTTFAQKRLVTCGTGAGGKVPNVHGNHAYAVTGYDATTDQISLWNPHGQTFTPKGQPGLENGYPTKDGRFRMPLAEFMQAFGGLAFETAVAAK